VRELTAAAERIAGGDLAQQVPVRSRDELGALAGQFNHMSADLARATRLRQQMTADIQKLLDERFG
jgi:nitrogen fixation/metabolism regulation signal transduction histidine kinase